MPRRGNYTAQRGAGTGAGIASDGRRDDGADVFRYAGIERERGCGDGEFGVWADGGGDGDEWRLCGGADCGSCAARLADVYRDGDGAGWDYEYFERVYVWACADFAERQRGHYADGIGQQHEGGDGCVRAWNCGAGQHGDGVDSGAALQQLGDGVFYDCQQGGVLWSDTGFSEDYFAGELLRRDGGYVVDYLRPGNLFGYLGGDLYAAGAYGIDRGEHGDDGGGAYGELDGRERDAAAGTVLPGADGVGYFWDRGSLWGQRGGDVCGRDGNFECGERFDY